MKNINLFRNKLSIFKKPSDFIKYTKSMFSKKEDLNNTPSDSIKFVKVDDLKKFGKKFTDEEVKKYLDPFGFLSTGEYKDVKTNEAGKAESIKKELDLQKLEEIENIVDPKKKADEKSKNMPREYGYKYQGPEPTRYGDWEVKGKCVDF